MFQSPNFKNIYKKICITVTFQALQKYVLLLVFNWEYYMVTNRMQHTTIKQSQLTKKKKKKKSDIWTRHVDGCYFAILKEPVFQLLGRLKPALAKEKATFQQIIDYKTSLWSLLEHQKHTKQNKKGTQTMLLTVLSSLNSQPLCAREKVIFFVDICAATISLLISMSTSSSRSRSLSCGGRANEMYK